MAKKTKASTRRKSKPSRTKAKQQNARDLTVSEIEALKSHIAIDVKREVKKWVWRPVAILLIIGGFFGVTTYTGVKNLQKRLIAQAEKDMKKDIKELYNEKNVARVVNDVIRQDANDLIKEQVKTEVEFIMTDLKQKQDEYAQALSALYANQQKYSRIILLNELVLKAQNGDLESFKRLEVFANSSDKEFSVSAVEAIRRTYEMYFGQDSISYKYFREDLPNSEVVKRFEDDNFILRKLAVFTVRKRQMYGQIPTLIKRIQTEPNLDVLAAIQVTLNILLGENLRVLHDEAVPKYMEVWKEKKDQLLKSQDMK